MSVRNLIKKQEARIKAKIGVSKKKTTKPKLRLKVPGPTPTTKAGFVSRSSATSRSPPARQKQPRPVNTDTKSVPRVRGVKKGSRNSAAEKAKGSPGIGGTDKGRRPRVTPTSHHGRPRGPSSPLTSPSTAPTPVVTTPPSDQGHSSERASTPPAKSSSQRSWSTVAVSTRPSSTSVDLPRPPPKSVPTTPTSASPTGSLSSKKPKKRQTETKELMMTRRRVIHELVKTEETYVGSLQSLLKDLLIPIEKKYKAKLPKSTQLTLISSAHALEVLTILHKRFLEDLRARASPILAAVERDTQKREQNTAAKRGKGRGKPVKASSRSGQSSSITRKLATKPPRQQRLVLRTTPMSASHSQFRSTRELKRSRTGGTKGRSRHQQRLSRDDMELQGATSRLSGGGGSPASSRSSLASLSSSGGGGGPSGVRRASIGSPRAQISSSISPRGRTSSGGADGSDGPETGAGQRLSAEQRIALDAQMVRDQQQVEGSVIDLFQEYSDHFKMYFKYVQNYPKLSMDLAGDVSSRTLSKFIADQCRRLRTHGILSLLILPIQRIPRYLLLLESLHKSTPELHLYLRTLEKTLQKLLEVTKQIDECQRQSDNSLKLFNLQKNIQGAPTDFTILLPSRDFIRQETLLFLAADSLGGKIDETKWADAESLIFVLFNDVLIIVTNKTEYKKHFMLHDVAIYESKGKAEWGLYTGSPELLYGRVAFKSKAHRRHWAKITFPVIEKAKATHLAQARVNRSKDTKVKSVVDHVNVFMRVRPFVTQKEKDQAERCLALEDENIVVLSRPGGAGPGSDRKRIKVGVYDHCFGERATQIHVFQRVGEEVLGSLFCGYNCCIIAYGNTGSGKTHTIMGEQGTQRGLVPRTLEQLFSILRQHPWRESKVQVSYVQIYCNKLYDLQGSEKHTLKSLKIVKKKDIHEVSGVVKTNIQTAREGLAIIEQGNKKRVTRAHKMNDASSRSHSVFTIHCRLHNAAKGEVTKSMLQLVDLAGSENVKETGVEGVALTESTHINRSLTSLGRALHQVVSNEGKTRKAVISFRETTLTHMLSDVLSGSFVCSLILTASCSPAHQQAELTAKTMAFGSGAKRIDLRAQQHKSVARKNKLRHFLSGVWRTVRWGS